MGAPRISVKWLTISGSKYAVRIIDFRAQPKRLVKVMLSQISTEASFWKKDRGPAVYADVKNLERQISTFLKCAKDEEVDLLVFPELSVPASLIKSLRRARKSTGLYIIAGSHYFNRDGKHINRSPMLSKHGVHHSEKLFPSYKESIPFLEHTVHPGREILVCKNSLIGSFAILICNDYLNQTLRAFVAEQQLDYVLVVSFQQDSKTFHKLLDSQCSDAEHGSYLIYSNMLCPGKADGNSALFALTEKRYFTAFVKDDFASHEYRTKLFELRQKDQYVIFRVDRETKRPYQGRTSRSGPNVYLHCLKEISMQKPSLNQKSKMRLTSKRSNRKSRKSIANTLTSLAEYIKKSKVISGIDLYVSNKTQRPIVYADRFVQNYLGRVEYLGTHIPVSLDNALRREQRFLCRFLIEFCKTEIAETWTLTPSGMCISFLCYARILRDSGVEALSKFLAKSHFNQKNSPEEIAASVAQAYKAAKAF